MQKIVGLGGELIGIVGVALCVVSGLSRLFGQYLLLDYEMGTIFLLGIGLMVMGCLAQLYVIRRELSSGSSRLGQ